MTIKPVSALRSSPSGAQQYQTRTNLICSDTSYSPQTLLNIARPHTSTTNDDNADCFIVIIVIISIPSSQSQRLHINVTVFACRASACQDGSFSVQSSHHCTGPLRRASPLSTTHQRLRSPTTARNTDQFRSRRHNRQGRRRRLLCPQRDAKAGRHDFRAVAAAAAFARRCSISDVKRRATIARDIRPATTGGPRRAPGDRHTGELRDNPLVFESGGPSMSVVASTKEVSTVSSSMSLEEFRFVESFLLGQQPVKDR